ncbi:MAG: hypothetical protein HKL80_10295 [Acidimicrobiales bacterium]|nr:hypothetical protein [Acidimicrobiales bacterium]
MRYAVFDIFLVIHICSAIITLATFTGYSLMSMFNLQLKVGEGAKMALIRFLGAKLPLVVRVYYLLPITGIGTLLSSSGRFSFRDWWIKDCLIIWVGIAITAEVLAFRALKSCMRELSSQIDEASDKNFNEVRITAKFARETRRASIYLNLTVLATFVSSFLMVRQ